MPGLPPPIPFLQLASPRLQRVPAKAWLAAAGEESGELGVVIGERLVKGQLVIPICQNFDHLTNRPLTWKALHTVSNVHSSCGKSLTHHLFKSRMDAIFFIISVNRDGHESLRHS